MCAGLYSTKNKANKVVLVLDKVPLTPKNAHNYELFKKSFFYSIIMSDLQVPECWLKLLTQLHLNRDVAKVEELAARYPCTGEKYE